ncbi:MAG: NERD domain-containing protein [Leptolyngbyaceae cyanobacterium bins.59]|nr:NERD domain-containing protein [Leptolyngbyaceae cyanobacterium bins.59]
MIVKELGDFFAGDKFGQAGRAAEEQIAHYLNRAFKTDENFHIFNNLRFAKQDDAAQIDHLVLHRYGVILIESKSVTTRVEVNELGEWKRWFGNSWQGMASPVLQVKRQGEFLREYLENQVEKLLSKTLGMQHRFTNMPINGLVAISDSGIINRPASLKLDEVCKADQVPDKVRSIWERRKKADSFFNLDFKDVGYSFEKDEFNRISDFLLQEHQLLKHRSQAPTPKPVAPVSEAPQLKPKSELQTTLEKHQCRHCQSSNVRIEYGKYGYYFKCVQCDGNTSIQSVCPSCGGKDRIRKSGPQFFAECEKCDRSRLFHTNPA